MKKLIIGLVVLVVMAGAGGAWWRLRAGSDPFANAKAMMDKGDLKGAQIELRNAVRDDPSNAEAHFRLGIVQIRLGDAVAAEKEFRAARDDGFDPRQANPALAQSMMAQGKFKEVLEQFPATGLPPEQAGPMTLMRGLAQMQLNQLPAAQASFTAAETLMPGSAEPVLASARAAMAARDFTGAEAKVDRALTINAKSADAMLLKGQLLNLKGDRAGALAVLSTAIAANPNMLSARIERATILLSAGDDAKAREDVEQVLKLEPRSAAAVYLQAVLLARAKDFTAADADLTKIATLLPRFPRGYYFQSVVKFNLGQAEQAADAATKYVTRNPTDADGVKLLARIDLAGQRPEQAVEVLNKAVGAGHADADMLDLLGRAYALSGNRPLAVDSYEKAVVLSPNNPDLLARLASARLGVGDANGAADDLQHSLELEPNKTETGAQLVVAALAAGEPDRAAAALDKLKATNPGTETVGNLTGMLKLAQLDIEGARQAFEAVLKAYPSSVIARMNLARIAAMQDRPADSEQYLTEILNREPANDQALSALVNMMVANGRIARAVALVEAAHAAAPSNTALTVALSNLYLRNKTPDKALEVLDAAAKGQAPIPALIGARARALVAAGKIKDAEDIYRQILAKTPADLAARASLVDLLTADKDIDGARAVLRDGLKTNPANPGLLQALVAFDLKNGGPDQAIATANQLAADPANLPTALVLKGDALMAARRVPEAIAEYTAQYKAAPTALLAARLSGALKAAGKSADAQKVLVDYLATKPNDIAVQQLLVSLELEGKDLPAAQAELLKILAERPNDVSSLNNLAWIYSQTNNPKARAMAQKAYILGPSPQVADTLGWILTNQGDAATALPLMRQAGVAMPSDAAVQYHLAVTLKTLGKKDEAVTVLRPLVQSKAEFPDKAAAQKLFGELGGT